MVKKISNKELRAFLDEGDGRKWQFGETYKINLFEVAKELFHKRQAVWGYKKLLRNANYDLRRFVKYSRKLEKKIALQRYFMRQLIEDAENLDKWVMGFYELCACGCNRSENKSRIERARKLHADLKERVETLLTDGSDAGI